MYSIRELNQKKEEFENYLKDFGIDVNCFKIQRSKQGTKYQVNPSKEDIERCAYAIQYFPDNEYFLIWDMQYHRELNKGKSFSSLSICDDNRYHRAIFKAHYKKVQSTNKYEKVCIVGMDHFKNFFENYALFMNLNEFDEEFPQEAKTEVNWFDPTTRKKYSVSIYARKYNFRKEVLEAYNNQCAICRCQEEKLLQAAHIVPVAQGGSDLVSNGICLCANHHLMFDSGLIKIDFQNLKLLYTAELVEKMPWYKEFQEKYDGRILQRIG